MTKLVLKCLDESFKFEPKTISLTNQIIIGRQVDGNSTRENGMFECRVLSKNHAIIWREDSKVFIRDTNSSNGTFVNDKRINTENDSQNAHEIVKGTILQFGVSVTTPDGSFHPCVICKVDFTQSESSKVPAPPTDWIVGCSRMAEMESLVSKVALGQEKVQRQIELFESNLSVWEESIRFNVQGKLKVNDLIKRISFLHDKLSLVNQEKAGKYIDENSVLEMSNKRDSLYKAEIESTLRENEDLKSTVTVFEEKVSDYEEQVKYLSDSVEWSKRAVEESGGKIKELKEDNENMLSQLDNSEETAAGLKLLIEEYKDRVTDLEEEFSRIQMAANMETANDLICDSNDEIVHLLEDERAKCASLSNQICFLSEAAICANTRFSQLSYEKIDALHCVRSVGTVGIQTEDLAEIVFEGVRRREVVREDVVDEPKREAVNSGQWVWKGVCLILVMIIIYLLFINF